MVLLYAFTAWVGGLLTTAALWGPCGPVLAVAAAPLGASALTAGTALLVYLRPARRDPADRTAAPRYRWHPAR